jgi:DNA repair protein RecO (recombination protein O)
MIVVSEGIVLRTIKYSDSSVISKIYTREKGMLSFLIQGVYSKKAAIKPSMLQLLQPLELHFYFHQNKSLFKIKELRPSVILNNLHYDLNRSSIAVFMSELINKSIQEEETHPALYDFLMKSILMLDSLTSSLANFPLLFLLEYSKLLGFYPNNNYSNETPYFELHQGMFTHMSDDDNYFILPPASEYLGKMLEISFEQFDTLSIPKQTRQLLLKKLIAYYQIHLHSFRNLNSIQVLEDMYSGLK